MARTGRLDARLGDSEGSPGAAPPPDKQPPAYGFAPSTMRKRIWIARCLKRLGEGRLIHPDERLGETEPDHIPTQSRQLSRLYLVHEAHNRLGTAM